jgi:hypothetical protein
VCFAKLDLNCCRHGARDSLQYLCKYLITVQWLFCNAFDMGSSTTLDSPLERDLVDPVFAFRSLWYDLPCVVGVHMHIYIYMYTLLIYDIIYICIHI